MGKTKAPTEWEVEAKKMKKAELVREVVELHRIIEKMRVSGDSLITASRNQCDELKNFQAEQKRWEQMINTREAQIRDLKQELRGAKDAIADVEEERDDFSQTVHALVGYKKGFEILVEAFKVTGMAGILQRRTDPPPDRQAMKLRNTFVVRLAEERARAAMLESMILSVIGKED